MEPSPRRPAAHPDPRQERARRRVRRRVGSGTRCAWCWARRHDWCGVEAVASQAALAREQPFDEVVQGYFPEAMTTGERFDLISFNDVLEHVVDPWETLRECREFLTPDGRVLAAIPNVQYTPVSLGLLGGHAMSRRVVLDRTHLIVHPRNDRVPLRGHRRRHSTMRRQLRVAPPTGRDLLRLKLGPGRAQGREPGPQGLLRAVPDSGFMHFVVIARPRPTTPGTAG